MNPVCGTQLSKDSRSNGPSVKRSELLSVFSMVAGSSLGVERDPKIESGPLELILLTLPLLMCVRVDFGPMRRDSRKVTQTSPPLGVKFNAFETRFRRTCAILLLSTSTKARSNPSPPPPFRLCLPDGVGDEGTV
jgi:hypothetical protein